MDRLLTNIALAAALVPALCWTLPVSETWVAVPLRTAEQKTAGFAGGEMGQMGFCLTISRKDPSRLAMSLDTAGVYISRDGGATWQVRRSGLRSNGAASVAFDPENANVLFADGGQHRAGQRLRQCHPARSGWRRAVAGRHRRALAQRRFRSDLGQDDGLEEDSFGGLGFASVAADPGTPGVDGASRGSAGHCLTDKCIRGSAGLVWHTLDVWSL